MPISRHARWMRSAISPRLAMRTFSNIMWQIAQQIENKRKKEQFGSGWLFLTYNKQGLAELDRFAVFDKNLLDDAGCVCLDFVQEFHGFDDTQRITLFDC